MIYDVGPWDLYIDGSRYVSGTTAEIDPELIPPRFTDPAYLASHGLDWLIRPTDATAPVVEVAPECVVCAEPEEAPAPVEVETPEAVEVAPAYTLEDLKDLTMPELRKIAKSIGVKIGPRAMDTGAQAERIVRAQSEVGG